MQKACELDLSTNEASALRRTQREEAFLADGACYSENMTCAEWHFVSKRFIHSIIQQVVLNAHSVFLAYGTMEGIITSSLMGLSVQGRETSIKQPLKCKSMRLIS